MTARPPTARPPTARLLDLQTFRPLTARPQTARLFCLKRTILALLPFIFAGGLYSQPSNRIAGTAKVGYDWQPGFVSITELAGGAGLGDIESVYSKYYYGIVSQAAWQFSRNIKAGAGAGIQLHNGGPLFPVFLDLRINLNSRELVPYLSGSGGIMVDVSDLDATRLFINPSLGLRYVAANRKAVTFSTGVLVSTGGPLLRKSFLNFRLGMELKARKQ